MAASNQIVPKSGINHVGFDYMSPQTAAQKTIIQDASVAGTEWMAFDHPNQALEVDTIEEFTSASGVTIDSALIKDGGVRLLNDTYLKARNNADSSDLNIVKVNTSDTLTFGTAIASATFTTATITTASIPTINDCASINRTGGALDIGTDDANDLRFKYNGSWRVYLTGDTFNPIADVTQNLGSGSRAWASLFVERLDLRGTHGNGSDDPTTDAPADWIEINLIGSTFYIPVYN